MHNQPKEPKRIDYGMLETKNLITSTGALCTAAHKSELVNFKDFSYISYKRVAFHLLKIQVEDYLFAPISI